jgi:5-methylcytosine-specific restriction protein A
MKRSKPLRRVARLVSRGPLRRTTAKEGGAHRRRPTGPDLATTQLVLARAGGCDEITGEPLLGVRGRDWDIHHRRPRRMGGDPRPDTNRAPNLLVILRRTHDDLESHRADALTHGWLLHAGDDPAAVAVLLHHGSRWAYLTDDGLVRDQPPATEVPA